MSESIANFDETLKQFMGLRPISAAEDAQWTWEHRTKPDMRALGWDDRSIRRIAPDWNCAPQAAVFEQVTKLCRGVGAVVALVGARGVGKTTVAAEHTRLRIEAQRAWYALPEAERTLPSPSRPGRYEKLGRLAGMFKPLYADFGSPRAEELARLLDTWCDADLVTLDELHEGALHQHDRSDELKSNQRFLVDFVDRRYANGKDTILISNKDAAAFHAEVNPSIISRIGQYGKILSCNWRSWRTQK